MKEKSSPRRFFDSARVSKAVGIGSLYLNKFIERKRYGIEPSLQAGEGRGSRRFFTEHDVYGIALVWWLFEGGLRAETVQYVLNDICGDRKKASANEAAQVLLESVADMMAIARQPRIGRASQPALAKQEVTLLVSKLEDPPGYFVALDTLGTKSVLVIPFQALFENLRISMQKYGVSAE